MLLEICCFVNGIDMMMALMICLFYVIDARVDMLMPPDIYMFA